MQLGGGRERSRQALGVENPRQIARAVNDSQNEADVVLESVDDAIRLDEEFPKPWKIVVLEWSADFRKAFQGKRR
jgi:hypothetical protein